MRDRKVSEGPTHWGPGVRSQDFTLGAIGSHREFVSTDRAAPQEKNFVTVRQTGKKEAGGLEIIQGVFVKSREEMRGWTKDREDKSV